MNALMPLEKRDIPPLLEFKNITVIKGATKVLDRVSLTIAEGENVAILGPNGRQVLADQDHQPGVLPCIIGRV